MADPNAEEVRVAALVVKKLVKQTARDHGVASELFVEAVDAKLHVIRVISALYPSMWDELMEDHY